MYRNFNHEDIVESYRLDKIQELDQQGKLMDFTHPLQTRSQIDLQVLESWKKYFTEHKVPWVITKHKSPEKDKKRAWVLIMWKEKIAEDSFQAKLYQNRTAGKSRGRVSP